MTENPFPTGGKQVPDWVLEILRSPNQVRHDAWNKGSDFVINLLEKAGTDGLDSLSDEGIEGKLKDWLKLIYKICYNQGIEDAVALIDDPMDKEWMMLKAEMEALRKKVLP